MNVDALPPYLELYTEAADEKSPNHRAACWETAAVQRRRFQVLAELYPLGGKVVVDAGCGRGDLAAFLREVGIRPRRYIGIDALPSVIAHARKRGLTGTEFLAGDLVLEPGLLATGRPDVVLISGTINTLTKEQALGVLDAAWRAASDALVFNFLSDLAGPGAPVQHPPIVRHPVLELLAWAAARTSQVAFRQDYFDHGHDATIRMMKE